MTLATDLQTTLQDPAVGMNTVIIRSGAIDEIPAIVGPDVRRIAYLVDETKFRTNENPDVKDSVALTLQSLGEVTTVLLRGAVHADEATVDQAVQGCAGADIVVTFGSGTLSDIGKVAAASAEVPHVIIQSAASVNGYADDQSVLLIKGVKRTAHSAWPRALVIDTDVVAAAPVELNASGLGDMISMFTAPADWYLSSLFDMDRGWNADAAVMTRRYGDELLEIAAGIGAGEVDANHRLAEFVTLSGFSMGVAGQTSPSSGMEHTVSHMLDMSKGARHEHTAYHGAQVAVATVMASLLWRRTADRIAAGEIGRFTLLSDEEAEVKIQEAFGWMDADGSTARECWNDYSKKLAHLRTLDTAEIIRSVQAEWDNHTAQLDNMLMAPERIVSALQAAGAPTRFSDLNHPIARRDVEWALANCHLMRNRFTIADLAFATGGWGPEDVAAILEEADALEAGA